jgi:hypothetical protein
VLAHTHFHYSLVTYLTNKPDMTSRKDTTDNAKCVKISKKLQLNIVNICESSK